MRQPTAGDRRTLELVLGALPAEMSAALRLGAGVAEGGCIRVVWRRGSGKTVFRRLGLVVEVPGLGRHVVADVAVEGPDVPVFAVGEQFQSVLHLVRCVVDAFRTIGLWAAPSWLDSRGDSVLHQCESPITSTAALYPNLRAFGSAYESGAVTKRRTHDLDV